MSFNFVCDRIIKDKAYPALARHSAEPYTAEWRQFVQYWPNTVPCELHEHCVTHNYPHTLTTESGDYYTIGLGFFNFDLDYFALIPEKILDRAKNILFYYHEGDNPYNIKKRLDHLCDQHGLNRNLYRFISGNTVADEIPQFAWFPDHELLYWHRNRNILPASVHLNPRPYDFTLLSRTHKWWRATVVADLHRAGLLDNSQWSYNTVDIGDRPEDNPIEIDSFDQLRTAVDGFLAHAPYSCDATTIEEQNDHHRTEYQHYLASYFNIVVETHFDADGSGGAFLTEKTFKPIKHGQPFVIVGAPGSLQALRNLGYRTFDNVIDTNYDTINDNTKRWLAIRSQIETIKQNPAHYFNACLDDVLHNQHLFAQSKYNRLNSLLERLTNV